MSAEEQMITPLPDIQHMLLDPTTDHFIVMACDGIWNSMSSQEVIDFVSNELKTQDQLSKVCEELFDLCLSADTSGDGTGCDNMTAIIINISKMSSGVAKRRLSNSEERQEESKKPKIETEV
jgi:protein phosphatase 1G